MDKNIVIVGGGISGLYCALKLSQHGFTNVVLLEASDRLGGRIHTQQFKGKFVELGAQWIHGRGENPVWKYVLNNNLPVSDDGGGDGDGEFYLPNGQQPEPGVLKETLEFLEAIHEEMDELENVDKGTTSVGQHLYLRFLDFIKKEGDPHNRSVKWSVYDWFVRWENVDTGAKDLDQQSIRSWGEYIDYDREDREADPILENGYGSLVDHILQQLGSSVDIRLNSRVEEIKWEARPLNVTYTASDKMMNLQADHVIVSVSLGVLKENPRLFCPSPPPKKKKAIELMGFGVMNKIFIEFEEPFWNSEEEGGIQLLSKKNSESGEDVEDSVHWTNSIPGFDRVYHQPNVLVGWICSDKVEEMENSSNEQILDDCWRLLKSRTGKDIKRPSSITVSRWGSNSNFRGSYSYRTPACDKENISPATLAKPLMLEGKLSVQFCGEATCTSGYGTVHGAFQSGEREAKRLIKYYSS